MYEKWKQWQYYVIIGVISLVALLFLPMIGSQAGLAWNLPNTVVGWIVYIVSKLLVATLNILIFHCFILQAKVNIQNDPNYLEAVNILGDLSSSDVDKIRSPGEYYKETYGKKGVTVFVTSILSAVGLTQAVLTFDWVSMLTYFVTILMGLIFGVLQMNQTETFWTSEYPKYAKKVKEAADAKAKTEANQCMALDKEEHLHERDDSSSDTRGTDILVSTDTNSSIGNTD